MVVGIHLTTVWYEREPSERELTCDIIISYDDLYVCLSPTDTAILMAIDIGVSYVHTVNQVFIVQI